MKAAYQALAVIVPIIIIVSAVAFITFASPSQEQPDDPIPVEPEPVPEDDLPEGISYDRTTRTLSSVSETAWHVFDDLHAYSENGKVYEGYQVISKSIVLDPGKYTITVGGDEFTVTVSGKVMRTVEWNYLYNGTSYPVSVSYSIDIDDYVEINERSWEYNEAGSQKFRDLPQLVTVNDTVRGILSQLEERFIQIGGSTADRQAYAEFLASMAQIPVEYPAHEGYGDRQIWGMNEYWQDTMETLYHVAGDCEDKSALACSLFVAAGYKAAMCGVIGHVAAGISIDGFKERSAEELKAMGMQDWVVASAKDVTGQDADTVYYGVETIHEEQHYVGYLQEGPARCIGEGTIYWGTAGFYPVN